MTWWQIAGAIAPTLAVVATLVGVRFSRKTGAEANRTDAWDRLLERQESWTTTQQARIDRLERKLSDLEDRFTVLEGKYRVAVGYIRRLVRQLQLHVDADDIESPPKEISPDL